ncbi:MAG: aldehyde dehydrogenase family protein [Candidatus Orphnella occulta]|nr:aldehyde dehydrogenase family protein [Candidatus Orphnella occulta]MDP8296793.1 aldehyde dehydrogenase family protein [Candidatus Orphnella occulta]
MEKTAVVDTSTTGGVDIENIMQKASFASAIFSQLSQEHTDRIVKAVYEAGFKNRIKLAKMAHEETKLGVWEDKVIKNVVATQFVYEDIKNLKTVGIISDNEESGIIEIAQPIGPIFALIPVTNPTSTVMFKILIALKTRNPIIISPHHRAMKCSNETARICYEAALKEDAPQDCIQWLEAKSSEGTRALMKHKKLALVLATGGSSLVGAAYSSGTPAIGVGPGNVPAYIGETADVGFAVEQIFTSKTFDNGTVCASEQSIIVDKSHADKAKKEIEARKGYFLSDDEIKRVEDVAFDKERGLMNAAIVGQSAAFIAKLANIDAPSDVRLLIAPLKGIGKDYPLSSEVLAPILAYYIANDFEHAVNLCIDLNFHGGIGHTVSIYSNDDKKIREFASVMNAGRIVVNTPSSQGAVGGLYNTLHPSFTLGCGSGGKNITTDNITARHLLNIQRIARRRVNRRLEKFDTSLYLDESIDTKTLEDEFNRNY